MGNTVLKPLGLTPEEKKYMKAFLAESLSGGDIAIKSLCA